MTGADTASGVLLVKRLDPPITDGYGYIWEHIRYCPDSSRFLKSQASLKVVFSALQQMSSVCDRRRMAFQRHLYPASYCALGLLGQLSLSISLDSPLPLSPIPR
jgi:hypothetical protein